MLRLSLVALFGAVMATFALAAASMPLPPHIADGRTTLVADASTR